MKKPTLTHLRIPKRFSTLQLQANLQSPPDRNPKNVHATWNRVICYGQDTIAIETFALEQLDDCKKNEPYIKKRLLLNGHQGWPHECPR